MNAMLPLLLAALAASPARAQVYKELSPKKTCGVDASPDQGKVLSCVEQFYTGVEGQIGRVTGNKGRYCYCASVVNYQEEAARAKKRVDGLRALSAGGTDELKKLHTAYEWLLDKEHCDKAEGHESQGEKAEARQNRWYQAYVGIVNAYLRLPVETGAFAKKTSKDEAKAALGTIKKGPGGCLDWYAEDLPKQLK